ncbi:5-(carboxyamino)imidazole ribonucleotide mutase [bacterium]|nr:5-(carboxyamino)imidazole ribonucleotide mutase [bacterium]
MIGIILGSPSDLPVAQKGLDLLEELGIPHKMWTLSAHRTPDRLREVIEKSPQIKAWVGFAGLAAHLCGAMAAHTIVPVLGVPVPAGPLQGEDALLSMVQMPPGIPVGVVGIGNARNGVLLAAQILAITDPHVAATLQEHRKAGQEKYG